jgi:hypothetical protein
LYETLTFTGVMRSLRKAAAAATGLLVLTASVNGLSATASADLPHGSLADPADVAAMLTYEGQIADSIQQGHVVPIDYRTPERAPGDVVGTGGWGDSGLWTGVYLGGQALRLGTATRYLRAAGLSSDETAFWTAQRDEALSRIRTISAAEHRDITIAQDWTGSLKLPPDVNTDNPGGTHLANVGGGIIKGEPGMVMRSCTPVGLGRMGINDPTLDPAKPVNNNSNRVFQITWAHGDGKTYNCETSPSRDTYAGMTFGMLTAFDMLQGIDDDLRYQIGLDLITMGNFLFKYAWTYPRPHGYLSAKHDFDGAFSPLFVYVPMARLNLTNAVRHVVDSGVGGSSAQTKWRAIWKEEWATQLPQLAGSLAIDSAQPNDGYYKFNLHHLTSFNLMRTTAGVERQLLGTSIAAMDKTTRDDLNAHFEAIMWSITGEPARLAAAVAHLRQWLDYRAAVESGPVVNSTKCGTSIVCVPEDKYEVAVPQAPGGAVAWFPGSASDQRAARPLPVAARPPTDFLWQRSPTSLDGNQGPTGREPGIDFLTPYWMIRYYTEVAGPALRPLPEWVGPAHY